MRRRRSAAAASSCFSIGVAYLRRYALRVSESGGAEVNVVGPCRVSAHHRYAGPADPLVQLDHPVQLRIGRQAETDEQRVRIRT